jgi:hypothetical protein
MRVIKQESAQIVKLFGDHGAEVHPYLVLPIWIFGRGLDMPSDVFREVVRIVERLSPHLEDLLADDTFVRLSTAVVFCGSVGMSYGGSVTMVNRARRRRISYSPLRRSSTLASMSTASTTRAE